MNFKVCTSELFTTAGASNPSWNMKYGKTYLGGESEPSGLIAIVTSLNNRI